ncbi:MAG: Sulfatase [Planctomycetaceae bacterium]|nr:Sulfatase [Planctomycetaceae bacterium]
MSNQSTELNDAQTRRSFLTRTSAGLGSAALASLLQPGAFAAPGDASIPHFAPKAKRVIYLFMSGGPSHLDLYDPKPNLAEMHGKDLPPTVRGMQRVTLMTRNQGQFLVAASQFKFIKHGQSGQELSEVLPHIGKIADDIAIVRSMHTEPINHDPAVNFIQTGSGVVGRPTIGSWLSYGLGSENKNLPEFIVLLSGGGGQPVVSRYWSNGFLPSKYQGVQFRSQGDPVLYLSNPPGIDGQTRKTLIDGVNELNQLKYDSLADPEIQTRINSFELAYRMQMSVPELMNLSTEPKGVLEKYGAQPGQSSFANNCLLARRLVERGVRFVQLYHRDWDHHGDLPNRMRTAAGQTDRASAALVQDLKERGMLNDTLIVWGGEFGRTTYNQGPLANGSYGRDHHPRCYSIWMAGGGIKGGITIGKTDDFGYNIVEDGVHVHDFQATMMHLLGINHEKLTYRFQGRDFRLTDVSGKVVQKLLA